MVKSKLSGATCSLPVSVSRVNKARGEMHVPSRSPLFNRAAILHFGPANDTVSLAQMPFFRTSYVCWRPALFERNKQSLKEYVLRFHTGSMMNRKDHPACALAAPQLSESSSLPPAMSLYTDQLFFRTTASPCNPSHLYSTPLVVGIDRNDISLRLHSIFDLPSSTSMVSDCTG